MSRVSTYLNFMGETEVAFQRYSEIFGTEISQPIFRFGDIPSEPGAPALSEEELAKIMHIELPIIGGHVLMATDMLESAGHELRIGNNITVNLELDTRAEAERLYDALNDGGSNGTGLNEMPWGAYWGCCLDKFGVQWMFNAPLGT